VRRLRLLLVLAGIALGAGLLLSWTQPWFEPVLTDGQRLTVPGQAAAPALSALGLAALALSAALSIAGRVLRVILGVVEGGIGVLVLVTAAAALGGPVAASASTVTDATAVSGADSVAALVDSVTASAWPWLALVLGALLALVGIAVLLTAPRWPGATRKYDAAHADEGTAGTWDALSEGRDPT
jgi:protein-S-isoprenylcysteine O-methyltransferase Ste14